jgi:hypothetical protein
MASDYISVSGYPLSEGSRCWVTIDGQTLCWGNKRSPLLAAEL